MLGSVNEDCLCHELILMGIAVERQVFLPVEYKGVTMPKGFRLTELKLVLSINFNVPVLKNGINRLFNRI